MCPFEGNLYILDIYLSSDRNEIIRSLSFLAFSSEFLEATRRLNSEREIRGSVLPPVFLHAFDYQKKFLVLDKIFPMHNYSVQLDMGICFHLFLSQNESLVLLCKGSHKPMVLLQITHASFFLLLPFLSTLIFTSFS